ncbi:MAG: hypothetical protein K2M89_01535 [Clostridiales bacterium]|nr:hypothetical protein [Clostridiales bacterium]
MENNLNNNKTDKRSGNGRGCLITITVTVIMLFIIIGFAITYFTTRKTDSDNSSQYNYSDRDTDRDTGTGSNSKPSLLSRSATLNDITISGDDLDLSSFGEKLTFTPKKDIDGLKLKFVFQKSNGTKLQTIEKSMGNVKEGKQYSVTISITELKWDVIKNAFDLQCKYTVSAGTVSYFA